jgi:hypothetical protein
MSAVPRAPSRFSTLSSVVVFAVLLPTLVGGIIWEHPEEFKVRGGNGVTITSALAMVDDVLLYPSAGGNPTIVEVDGLVDLTGADSSSDLYLPSGDWSQVKVMLPTSFTISLQASNGGVYHVLVVRSSITVTSCSDNGVHTGNHGMWLWGSQGIVNYLPSISAGEEITVGPGHPYHLNLMNAMANTCVLGAVSSP